jgi:hypothetical protein
MLIAPASGAFATPLRDFGGRELVLLLFEGFGRSTHCTIQLSTRQKVVQRERVPYLVESTPNVSLRLICGGDPYPWRRPLN